MPPDLKVVDLPQTSFADVPKQLRTLADEIERGEYGTAENVAWVVDCGEGRLAVGLMGRAAESVPIAHLLFARATRFMEGV